MKKHFLYFFVLLMLSFSLHSNVYHSQYKHHQDQFLNEKIFKGKRNGFFIEFGAYDGVKFSNTKFFEDNLGWKGICIEPIPEHFKTLEINRPNSICIQGCVSDKVGKREFNRVICDTFFVEMLSGLTEEYDPVHLTRVKREVDEFSGKMETIWVNCYMLNDIMDKYNVSKVDYLSIDTEGGELNILKSIDFDRFDITVIEVENNYSDPEYRTFLQSKGYILIDNEFDDLYIKSTFNY